MMRKTGKKWMYSFGFSDPEGHRWSVLYMAMRKLIFLFLFSSLYIAGYSQVIKGTVLDKDTKTKIDFASVYFNGTFVGTTSDKNGNFELDISKNISMPLTISAVGYYSVTLTDFSSSKPYVVYLTPKVFELKEVVVNSKSYARERKANLKLFKNVFLGTTVNASNCEITNEDDIRFIYDSDDYKTTAFAFKPIIIDNRALGYKITYYLDKFEFYKKTNSFVFKGTIIFKENLIPDEEQKQLDNRKSSYIGSRMHFLRALWANNLLSEGFSLNNSAGEKLEYKDIVTEENSLRKFIHPPEKSLRAPIQSPKKLVIYYKMLYISNADFLSEHVSFDQSGFYESTGISWEGEMIKQRIADLLPYEYSFE
jgi:hypothetical protein